MTFHVWTELVCAICAHSDFGSFSQRGIDRQRMAAEAKKAGWVRHGSDWWCKHCEAMGDAGDAQ